MPRPEGIEIGSYSGVNNLPEDIVTSVNFHTSTHFLPKGYSVKIGGGGYVTKAFRDDGKEHQLPPNHAIHHRHLEQRDIKIGDQIQLHGHTWATVLKKEKLGIQPHRLGSLEWEHTGFVYYVKTFKKS